MLIESLGNVQIADQRARRHAVVRPPVLAILIEQRRQRPGFRLAVPRRYLFAERSQRASPSVNRVVRGVTSATGAPPPFQPWSGIGARKTCHVDQRQLLHFNQIPLHAVCSEPAYPTEINLNRAPGQMASPPELNDRAFALITTFRIHAFLDAEGPRPKRKSNTISPPGLPYCHK
jgi:hypothetical protein